ncbi:BrnT family toxin [Candidatus Entotheonella palauensis]|uniref:BrnT family toxin n=1 Tax=Candidatus Entotheonella gemina TaxID=1429439 RepID=W4MAM1_9BACT|nr:BrnT family toxin [Candidatus Entotheonella palauensis]ETX07409.1 MAG: hypothetical protein ETSY2_11340 [Candidatus Entotheonella gemina]
MRYTWDPDKAQSNEADHEIAFADAIRVFEDVYGLSQEDLSAEGEDRYVVIGMDAFGRILTVVYTYRGDDTIRLISARRATRREWREYERFR